MKNQNALTEWILLKFYSFLDKVDDTPKRTYLYNFDQFQKKIKPCDVLLVESHTRIGNIIKLISESTWSHAVLYIGRATDIEDPALRSKLLEHTNYSLSDKLIIESVIGKGTIVTSLDSYRENHLRILRPTTLLPADAQKVIAYGINHIGKKYSIRHLIDLARFIFPWGIFPRRWRSSLFQHNALQPTEDTCSSLIAYAFQSVNFPILPFIEKDEKGYAFTHRNPRLYTPSDFDLSPFFDVIKYPLFPLSEEISYKDLHWQKEMISNDIETIKLSDQRFNIND